MRYRDKALWLGAALDNMPLPLAPPHAATMPFPSILLSAAFLIAGYMTVQFVVAVARQDNSIADIAWGPGFMLAGAQASRVSDGHSWRGLLILMLVSVWGLRLAVHIFLRNRGRGEDFRYAKWRRDWGRWFLPRSFLQVFMLQGALLLVIATPVLFAQATAGPPEITWLDIAGVVMWLVGFLFEAVGDWQLVRFTRSGAAKGRVMTTGLWRFTRHPNYFGEVVLWWGIFLVSCSIPGGWRTFPGPLTITLLILFVSGIPLLEARYRDHAEFQAYARRTNRFFPGLPRNP